jgi:hypothetical protein
LSSPTIKYLLKNPKFSSNPKHRGLYILTNNTLERLCLSWLKALDQALPSLVRDLL